MRSFTAKLPRYSLSLSPPSLFSHTHTHIHTHIGYYNDVSSTEAAFYTGGWYKTGDIGEVIPTPTPAPAPAPAPTPTPAFPPAPIPPNSVLVSSFKVIDRVKHVAKVITSTPIHTAHTHIHIYHIYTNIHTHTHTYIHTHIHTYTHIHTHTHTLSLSLTHTHTHTHTHTRTVNSHPLGCPRRVCESRKFRDHLQVFSSHRPSTSSLSLSHLFSSSLSLSPLSHFLIH